MKKCPVCDRGTLKMTTVHEEMYGVNLGDYPADVCTVCKESFIDEESMKKIEIVAKQKGIWGLGRKTLIAKTGNSLAVRIPKGIADFTGIKEGTEAFIHPEKGKIVIEL